MRQQSSSVPLACLHILHMQLCCYASLIFYASYITNDNSSMTSLKLGLGPICKKAAIIFLAGWVGVGQASFGRIFRQENYCMNRVSNEILFNFEC